MSKHRSSDCFVGQCILVMFVGAVIVNVSVLFIASVFSCGRFAEKYPKIYTNGVPQQVYQVEQQQIVYHIKPRPAIKDVTIYYDPKKGIKDALGTLKEE